jgi:sugar phosphate isomerase/epimerase
MPVVSGSVEPSELSRTGRRQLLHFIRGLGLQLAALGGDLGGQRFMDSRRVEQRLNETRAIIEMAAELRVPLVTTQLGRVDDESLQRGFLVEAVEHLAEIADRTGTFIALETAGTTPDKLADLLRRINAPSLGVCYDPGSLLLEGADPVAGIAAVANSILIARARDAVAGSPQRPGREVPLGAGELDLPAYLAQLDQAGYRNVPFIRRTESEHPLEDVAEAKRRLLSLQ